MPETRRDGRWALKRKDNCSAEQREGVGPEWPGQVSLSQAHGLHFALVRPVASLLPLV